MKNLLPQQSAINLEIEQVEKQFFSGEKDDARRRGNAFQYLCLVTLCDLNFNDINDIEDEDIIDGSDEEGVDIIHLDKSETSIVISIFNCKSSEKNNYSSKDITQLKTGLDYIFEEKEGVYQKLENFKLKKKIEDIREEKEKVAEVNIYYCVFKGDTKNIPKNVERKRDEIKERYNNFFKSQYPNAKFNFLLANSEFLFAKEIEKNESLRGKIIKIPYYDKGKIMRAEVETGEGLKGYLTTVNAKEIAKLVENYDDKLFEKNIRGWLKFKKSNKDIYKSCISEDSDMFWFMNNGITIVSDKIIVDDDKSIWKITNLQIVNGQQTAQMIYEAYKSNRLKDDVKVMCRLYEGTGSDFISKVAKATNSQISIGLGDLMSTDPMQVAIAKSFERLGYFYKTQSGQKTPKKKFKKTILSRKLAQVSLAILRKNPSLARKNIEDNFFNKSKYYEQIFKRDPKQLLLAYLIFEYCNQKSKENKNNELKYFGALHIARIIWEWKEKSFSKDIDLTIKKLETNEVDLKSIYKKASEFLNDILEAKRKEEKIISLGHYLSRIEVDEILFKKFSKSKF